MLINKAQNAFIVERQILDACLIVNEVIDFMYKKKERGVRCKLDIEKVYDRVNCNFIFAVIQKMGFRWKWVKCMCWCITTTSFSLLLNGSLEGFF